MAIKRQMENLSILRNMRVTYREHVRLFMSSMTVFAVLGVFAMTAGPSVSGAFVESSPFHGHVYLSPEAAQSYGTSVAMDHEGDSDVISVADHLGVASTLFAQVATPDSISHIARLSTFAQRPAPESDYANPLLRPPAQPPQYS